MVRWITRAALVLPLLYILYFHGLDRVGLLGPDEPRYASIGREMARSGDWVTPRLWGESWFEKPALLYWMTAAGFRLGLSPDMAPRIPVATMAVLFLAAYFLLLKEQFGERAAGLATAILATCAGWLAFAHIAVTDVPLAVAFSLAMLLSLEWLRGGSPQRLFAAGALLGVAMLAKGLVPIVLSAPLVWMGRRRLLDFWRVAAGALAIALPWYLLCASQNGKAFLTEFFWRHHFERFSSDGLQHGQPFWFYLPVLLAGLFPWTPLIGILRPPGTDTAARLLWGWLAFGLVFFSISVNKLPGYVLPLVPALCGLIGRDLADRHARAWLAACAVLMALIPAVGKLLPQALEAGVTRSNVSLPPAGFWLLAVGVAAGVWLLEARQLRLPAMGVLVAAVAASVLFLTQSVYPQLDRRISARGIWGEVAARRDQVCLDQPHRNLRYGLNYYNEAPLPDCEESLRPLKIR